MTRLELNGHGAIADRLPPQNLEAEEGVLGAMLHDAASADDVMAIVEPEDFYRDSHRILCRAIFELRSEGKPVDFITLEDELIRRGELDRAGGYGATAGFASKVPHSLYATHHAGLVRGLARKRAVIDACNAGLRAGYSPAVGDDELIEGVEASVFAISAGRSRRDTTPAHLGGSRFLAKLDDLRARGVVPGVRSGFLEVDDILGGSEGDQLIIVGARPSIGKTSYGLQWAMNVAEIQGIPSLYVSLEMSAAELSGRLLSLRSGVDARLFRNPRLLTAGHMEALGVAQAELNELPRIEIDDTEGLSAARIAARARRLRSKLGIGIVFVDYLQLVDPEDGRDPRHEQIAKVCRRLKALSRDIGVPVVALCQLNRAAESREDRRPRMADLRESGQLEQDAHAVLLLHRPEFYDPADRPGQAEVIVAKNRNGPTRSAWLQFDASRTRFADLSRADEESADF